MENIHNIPPTPVIEDDFEFIEKLDFCIVDVETTGVDPSIDRITEIAIIRFSNGEIIEPFVTLVDPEILIPPTASAVNHITNKTVAGFPKIGDLIPIIRDYVGDSQCVAHNAFFDRVFVNPLLGSEGAPQPTYHEHKYEGRSPDRGREWMCTMRLAKHLFPEAPGYSNEALRYWLGVEPEYDGKDTHRAGYDIMVTLGIFIKLVSKARKTYQINDIRDLMGLSRKEIFIDKLNWGAHKDKPLKDVPSDYIKWALSEKGQKNLSLEEGNFLEDILVNRRSLSSVDEPEEAGEVKETVFTIPFGDSKGKNIKDVSVKELKGIVSWVENKKVERYYSLIEAIKTELGTRGEEASSDEPLVKIRRFGVKK